MVVDASAVAAVVFQEEDGLDFRERLAGAPSKKMSAATAAELTITVLRRQGPVAAANIAAVPANLGIVVIPFTEEQAEIAWRAYERFGKGRHPAGLNLGDCFSYALARATEEPLLFKGNDFSRPDVEVA